MQLDDLDFTDDLALLSHTQKQMQEKTTSVAALSAVLDDLDFADNLALLSQTQQQMQEKTTSVAAASAVVSLNIHKGKSKILRCNTTCTNQLTHDLEFMVDDKTFTHLGSIIDEHGESDGDMKA
ncbi:unnamed protein product [Schistosoma margrebowiei]|uniref:Uncharacterized protein n=1 Tax=Schistosoma margrebowiei TaxID=48269 RepID=A0A183MLN2_9TREM|nr:unnamed protein product [Schistosoma margrebowiei]